MSEYDCRYCLVGKIHNTPTLHQIWSIGKGENLYECLSVMVNSDGSIVPNGHCLGGYVAHAYQKT